MLRVKNEYLKKVYNVLAANMLGFCCSVIITLVLPMVLSVIDYAEWQYFLLIFTYIELSQLGFSQGIYLRYGGEFLENINLKLIKSQICIVCILQFVLASIALYLGFEFVSQAVIVFFICMPIMAWRYFSDYLLQATGKTDEYAKVLIVDKVVFVITLLVSYFGLRVCCLSFSINSVFCSFLVAKLISALYSGFFLKNLIFADEGQFNFFDTIKEIRININVGCRLLLSTLCSLLIVGFIRFVIVDSLGKTSYAQIAIVLSVCSFVMVFVRAVSVVVFPNLRRMLNAKKYDLAKYYVAAYKIFNCCLLISLVVAYPLEIFFKYCIPKYSDSSIFLFILLPVIIFDSNWAIFGSSIMKVFHKENWIFQITSSSMILSFIMGLLIKEHFESLQLYSFLIVAILIFRFIYTECFVNRLFLIDLKRFNFIIVIETLFFIFVNLKFRSLYGILLFISSLLVFIKLNFNELKEAYFTIRRPNKI